MGHFINALKVSVIVIVLIGATYYKVNAYTYESDVDPKQFFNYTLINAEQMGGNRMLLTLKGETYPEYVLNLIIVSSNNKIMIAAYCYYDKEFNFKSFGLDKKGHYNERELRIDVEQSLRKRLDELHGINFTEPSTNV